MAILVQKANVNTPSTPAITNVAAAATPAVQTVSQSETNEDMASQLSDIKAQLQALREAQIACCRSQGNLELAATLDIPVLEQNTPNPFTENTTIGYYIPASSNVSSLNIVNAEGKIIKTFKVTPGKGQILLPAESLAAGTYYYNLVIDGKQVDSKKMILVK